MIGKAPDRQADTTPGAGTVVFGAVGWELVETYLEVDRA